MLTKRFDDAFCLASELHREQRRKGTRIPYISHLMAVAAIVVEHGGDENQAIAALLHDAAEDQGGRPTLELIEQRFGADVAEIVSDCTDASTEPKPPWRQRKEAYLAHLASVSSRSLLVSLADKAHNARAILLDHRTMGSKIWHRFNVSREETLWYYDALRTFYQRTLPGPLSREFTETVDQLENCV
jgi:(p)ppGpp synthase/HD superfamily hydrolase